MKIYFRSPFGRHELECKNTDTVADLKMEIAKKDFNPLAVPFCNFDFSNLDNYDNENRNLLLKTAVSDRIIFIHYGKKLENDDIVGDLGIERYDAVDVVIKIFGCCKYMLDDNGGIFERRVKITFADLEDDHITEKMEEKEVVQTKTMTAKELLKEPEYNCSENLNKILKSKNPSDKLEVKVERRTIIYPHPKNLKKRNIPSI